MLICNYFESPPCTMTMPQLETEGLGLLKVDDSAQKEFCSGEEPFSPPSPVAPSYIMKFTIDYTDYVVHY